MARVIGSTFRRPFTVQPRQESSLERNLAQFASPQGVYLLAKGIGSLGGLGLPWGGSEGGLGDEKVRLAAAARAQALDTVADSTRKARAAKNAAKNAAVGAVDPGLVSDMAQADKGWQASPRPEVEPLSEQEESIVAEFPERRPLGKPEQDRLGSYEMENLRAYEEGRSVRKEEDRAMVPGQSMGEAEEAAITEGQLMGMEEGELLALARAIPERNKMAKNEAMNYFQNWSESGQDPDLAMRAIGESRDSLKQYNQRIIGELTRRNTLRDEEAGVIRDAPDSDYAQDVDPIFSMAPNDQRAEIRRLAKSAKTTKDTERVRSLLQRHTPEVSTFADLFTSESDRRKEFETEVEKLFPAIDPFHTQKGRKFEVDILMAQAQIKRFEAEAKRFDAAGRADEAAKKRAEAEELRKAAGEKRKITSDAQTIENQIAQADKIRAETSKLTGPEKKKKSGRTKQVTDQVKASAKYLPDGGVKLNRELGRMLKASGGSLTNEQVSDLYEKWGLSEAMDKHAKESAALRKASQIKARVQTMDSEEDIAQAEKANP